MLEKALLICDEIVKRGVEEVVLFHSASGKDSIALLDILAPRFKRVVCVFMYVVKDMEHISRYINYACRKYPSCEFVQIPHFALFSYIKYGYMGHKCDPKQRLYNMFDLTEMVRKKYNIEWAFYGFKQSDSLNRRCMLRTYTLEAINESTKKCYPLSHYKNKDILDYIRNARLIQPERYGNGQSSGQNITDVDYLLYLRDKYPNDLTRLYREFPDCERLLFEYDYKKRTENNQKHIHHGEKERVGDFGNARHQKAADSVK